MATKADGRAGGRSGGYHSPLRERQAAATRASIVDAAITLFGDRGWAATTIPMIAALAGTAIDTIYAAFASKSNLLMAAFDAAIVGNDEETAMERPELALLAKGRRTDRVGAAVALTVDAYRRCVPVLEALQEAARSDEAARARLARYDEDRRAVTAAGLRLILGRPAPEDLVDAVWTLVSPEVFTMLTERRGWSVAEATGWLTEMAASALGGSRR